MALRRTLHLLLAKEWGFLPNSSVLYKQRYGFRYSMRNVRPEFWSSSSIQRSFFGGGQKKSTSSPVTNSPITPKKTNVVPDKEISDVEASPIKKVRKRAQVIESESEDEDTHRNSEHDKENKNIEETKCNSSLKNEDVPQLTNVTKSPQKENVPCVDVSSKISFSKSPSKSPASSSGCSEEASSSDVPPFRKTARKQFKRKSSGSTEEKQLHQIKKIKLELKKVNVDKENDQSSEKRSPAAKPSSNKENSPKEKMSTKSKLSLFKFSKAKAGQPKIGDMFSKKITEKVANEPMEVDEISPVVKEIDESLSKPKVSSLKKENSEEKNNSLDQSPIKGSPKCEQKSPLQDEKTSVEFQTPLSIKKSASSSKLTKENTKSPKDVKGSPKETKKSPKVPKKSPKEPKKSPKSVKKSPASKTSENKMNEDLKDTKDSPKQLGLKIEEQLNKSLNDSQSSIDESKATTPKLKNPFAKKPAVHLCTYDPSKKKYHPIDDAIWKKGERVPYMAFAKTFAIIEDTSGRLKTIEMLSNFLRSVIVLTPEDLLPCIYLCVNKVAPSFDGVELNVGDSFLMKAIAQTTGRSMERLKKDKEEYGDLGIIAEQSKSNQKMLFQPAPLTVKKVFGTLKEIGLMSGVAVQTKKVDKIKSLFVACKESEARFLIRSCSGKLRIGLAEQSVLQAIGQACFLTPPGGDNLNAGSGLSAEKLKEKIEEYSLIIKTTYCECPSYDRIVPVLLEHGIMALPDHCKLEPGIPLQPMLAHPTKGVDEILRRFENAKFTCEYKYDGERAQIHLMENGKMKIFSRNQEDNTTKYPDVLNRIKESIGEGVKSCVLDSEAVAYDVVEKKILPFQILSTRKRKDAVEKDIKVQVCIFPFDLLFLNGKNLVQETFEVRRKLLRENFKEFEGHLQFATSMDGTDTEEIQEFLDESIKGNCEGLMVKTLDIEATYEIAKRSRNWLKLKKDYLDGVGDTIDVVPIGGYMGKGKRVGLYGGFLLACYDPENEEYQSLCKIGTGFTEESLKEHTEFFKDLVIKSPKSYYRCDPSLSPDHWFDADKVKVWEIKCADLSISPVYKAANGLVDREKGISLRFPRFLRVRDDKNPEQATSAQQIADLYNSQDQIKNQTASKSKDDEDMY